ILPHEKALKELAGQLADSISEEDAERGRLAAPASEAVLVIVTARIGGPAGKGPKTRGVWDLPSSPRGEAIEKALGQNLPQNFPVIDKFENGLATSIKSMDLKSATYLKVESLTSKGECYVDKVAAFRGRRWAGVEVKGADIKGRALELAVPPGAATAEQQTALKALVG